MPENKILVISEGPPPLGDTHAEGGALRAWGLAKGLAYHGFDVTFAYRSTFEVAANAFEKPLPERITVSTWDGDTLQPLLERNRIVVMRYAMGEAQAIADRLKKQHILVSDSYIPISVEVAARRSKAKYENDNYLRLQESSAIATRRADYFLYASSAQKMYYIGYFAGLNKLNPATYEELEGRMFEVPYGIDPTDKDHKLVSQKVDHPTLLWYGAFYSWFDMESLIDSLLRIKTDIPDFCLLIAGAKNPYNKDAGILAHYEKTMRALERLGDTVKHIDWHPYEQRFKAYAKASAIITWNHLGLENQLAWRTRLMDFVLSDRPIITNGGDPLGEDLIKRNIAFQANPDTLDRVFEEVIKQPPKQEVFDKAAEDYSWVNLTRDLAEALKSSTNMTTIEMIHKAPFVAILFRRIRFLAVSPWKIVRSLKKNGLKRTISISLKVLRIRR